MTEIEKIRLKKLQELIKRGIDPYPSQTKRTHFCQEINENFDYLSDKKEEVTVAGRLISLRLHGKSAFSHLRDASGQIQIYFKADEIGQAYQIFKNYFDIGDFLEISGFLFLTKTQEKTILVKKFRLLSKSLLPLPEKWHGLEDVELRYRQRYLDLLANKEVREIFQKRSLIIKTIRDFFDEKGFMAVETPILQAVPGGANAKPFITRHQALDIDLYLSIAPELYLKRLIIGGFEKIYEIARCFRNEGIDWSHQPEFTQVEFYQAYVNYHDFMNLIEDFFVFLFKRLKLDFKIQFRRHEINFKPPYPRLKFKEVVQKFAHLDLDKLTEQKKLIQVAEKLGLKITKHFSRGKIIDEIFKKEVRPKIINPTFIINHPVELSPLAKKIPTEPNYVERFQLLVAGLELVNAFSELNNPLDQEERFLQQQKIRDTGDEEAQRYDRDFIEALKYGLPPTAGAGLGVDRLVAILTNVKNLKEVILFPTLRQKVN